MAWQLAKRFVHVKSCKKLECEIFPDCAVFRELLDSWIVDGGASFMC